VPISGPMAPAALPVWRRQTGGRAADRTLASHPEAANGVCAADQPRAREPLLLCGAVRAGIKRSDPCTVTFSSMLAAMIAGASPLCRWLERHLGLRGVAAEDMTKGLLFTLSAARSCRWYTDTWPSNDARTSAPLGAPRSIPNSMNQSELCPPSPGPPRPPVNSGPTGWRAQY
jgi:hypothetical protein